MKENSFSLSFQNHYGNQTKHNPQSVPYGRSGFAPKGGTGEYCPHLCPKFWNSLFCWMSLLTKKVSLSPYLLSLQTTYMKQVSLIAFRQILQYIFHVVHIFSFIITTCLKKLIGIKSLSAKHCPAEWSPWIIPPASPISPKIAPSVNLACSIHDIRTALPLTQNFLGKPCKLGVESLLEDKKNAHFLLQKNYVDQIIIFI